jgi:hypothetical protein
LDHVVTKKLASDSIHAHGCSINSIFCAIHDIGGQWVAKLLQLQPMKTGSPMLKGLISRFQARTLAALHILQQLWAM